ncbi:permease-like protein [Paenibacillus sp. JDR-2]|nr:permease-like protein [Paenibacillus sp. JDR-2]
MLPFYKKYWRTAFDIALIALTVYLVMFAFSYLYKIATPIFFAFVIYLCIEPLAKRLNKIGIKKSIASGISVLVFSLIIIGLFSGLAYIITSQGADFIKVKLPQYQELFKEQVQDDSSVFQQKLQALPPEWVERITEYINGATEYLPKLANIIFTGLIGYISSFSTFLFNFVIGIILAYFLSIEIKIWKKTANDKTPNTFKKAFFFLRENVFKGIGAYVKAQAKMMSITFLVIFAALLILRVENAFAISFTAGDFRRIAASWRKYAVYSLDHLFVPGWPNHACRLAVRSLDRCSSDAPYRRAQNYGRYAWRIRLHDAILHDRIAAFVWRSRRNSIANHHYSDQSAVRARLLPPLDPHAARRV